MKIKKLKIVNFRNYKELTIAFKENTIYLTGKNGQGKTNLTESIAVLSLLESFRTKSYDNLLRKNCDFFLIEGEFVNDKDQNLTIKINYDSTHKKNIYFQEKKIKKYSDFWGKIPLVYLIPNETIITEGPPAERRKFLDKLISTVSIEYFELLKKYNIVLKQKNSYLMNLKRENLVSYELLPIFNKQIVEFSTKIVKMRIDTLDKFKVFFKKAISGFSDHTGNYIYRSNINLNNYRSDLELKLKENIKFELIRGSAIIGAHKDDLEFFINDYNLKKYGSKGQHKIFLVALKSAQIDFIKSLTNDYPILILDDLFNELDNEKCFNISQIFTSDIQTFITSSDINKIDNFTNRKIELIEINEGNISNHEII